MKTKEEKVTIFVRGAILGVLQHEGTLIECGTRQYAQYPAAPFYVYKPRGKRNLRSHVEGAYPFFVIVRGWDLPKAPDGFKEARFDGVMTIRESKYASCDPRFETDFNAWFEGQGFEIVADYRYNKELEAKAA